MERYLCLEKWVPVLGKKGAKRAKITQPGTQPDAHLLAREGRNDGQIEPKSFFFRIYRLPSQKRAVFKGLEGLKGLVPFQRGNIHGT